MLHHHTDMMTLHEFEHKARLYVVGSLEPDEMRNFNEARRQFGRRGEQLIAEAHELAAAFALSLEPQRASAETKVRLLERIRASLHDG